METVAPMIFTWIPDDDLLLKNAIEAGASLEALAKGAVQFSRRFTYRELRDRWNSLLYDPDISAQASARMVEHELSGSNLSSNFAHRSENTKESKETHEKRKIGSIRRQYYAMRKKLRAEFSTSADLSFLAEPNLLDYNGNGGHFEEHITLDNQPPEGDCVVGDCMSDHFEFRETDFDILRNVFPEAMRDIAAANAVDNTGDAFHNGCPDLLEDNHRDRIERNNSLFEFHEDIPSLSAKESLRVDRSESFQQNNALRDITRTFKDNVVECGKNTNVEEIGPVQAVPEGKILETDDSGTKPLSASSSINEDLQNLCSRYGGKQHSSSPDSDHNPAIHTLGYSSPVPRMPLWRTMEDISAPAMPVDMGLHSETRAAEEMSTVPEDDDDDKKKGSETVYNNIDSHPGDGFINSTAISGGEFGDLSDSLLNFSNEDEIVYMDIDGKDTMDDFNSTLLSSSIDIHKDDVLNVEPKMLIASNTCLATSTGACPAESEIIASPSKSLNPDKQSFCHSEANLQSESLLISESLKFGDLSSYCTLNTEDPEIPCNDDIFLLIHPASSFVSAMQLITTDAIDIVSPCSNERGLNLAIQGKDRVQSFMQSQMVGRNNLPETCPNHIVVGSAVKSELPDTNCLDFVPRHSNKVPGDSSQCKTMHTTPLSAMDVTLDKDVIKPESGVVDTPATLREMPSQADAGSMKFTLPESEINPSTSDQEEPESDNDVPYFSDIEAMILEMDLGPYDQDPHFSRQVSRYQSEDSKRTIIRLEQCARSSLQRAMASQGSFAVFYGRHLKHYIRKTKVILGRSTNDIDVDIDLGKEGRANKISRRQAVIKIEGDGSFILKNLGKSIISVNGKEVGTGQYLSLSSSCLIEITGMSFVFEMDHKSVKRYLDGIARKNQGNSTNFEWMPAEGP